MADNSEKEEQAKVAYYYDAEKNPTGASYPGVPLADVLQDVYDAQPEWIQRAIDGSAMYRKTPVKGDKPAVKGKAIGGQ